MPFTLSHAAAALPVHALSRSRLPLAALMIGSISPDLVFYLPKYVEYDRSHSFTGLFTICLPFGLMLWLFFVRVLERPTLSWLPDAWRLRMSPTPPITWRRLAIAAAAVVLGAATHVVWDSFTHSSTPVVDALPSLRHEAFTLGGVPVRFYFLFQLISSVFGLLVLAAWALLIPRKPELPSTECVAEAHPRVTARDRWFAVLFLGAMSCLFAALNVARYAALSLDAVIFVLLVGGMAGAAIGWTLLAVVVRLRGGTGRRDGITAPTGRR
jgi:hypothetical protein